MLQPFLRHFNQNSIILEYSEAFVHKLATKLAGGDAGMVEPIKGFIRFFDTIRNRNDYQTYVKDNPNLFQRGNKPITDIKNVDVFNATQLEHIYDVFNPEAKKEKKEEGEQQPITKDADLVFPDDISKTIREINPAAVADDRYMEIYRGGDQATCTKFSHDIFGQSYLFCIGRKDSSNMYNSYRLKQDDGGGGGPRTFYFVRDYSRPFNDEHHLIVVHALKNGNFRYTNAPNNNGDKYVGTWENLVAVQPKLANHRDKFKYIPFSETEEDLLVLQHSDGGSFNTFTPRQRNVFIQSGKPLPMHYFTQLPTAEQNTYLNAHLQRYGLVAMSKYVIWHRGNAAHNAAINKSYSSLNKIMDTHPEWGLSNVGRVDVGEGNDHQRISAGSSSITSVSSFLNSLKFLKLNSKYYLDANGEPVPRREERLQPLKYFINHILNDKTRVISSEQAQEIFKFSYTDDQKLARMSKLLDNPTNVNYSDHQNTDFTLIECKQDQYLLIYNETDKIDDYQISYQGSLVILDSSFNVVSQPAGIIAITKKGFYIADKAGGSPYFVYINRDGDIEVNKEVNKGGIEKISNYHGKYDRAAFTRLSLDDKKAYLGKRLIKLAQDIAAADNVQKKNSLKFNCIIRDGGYDHLHRVGAQTIASRSKGIVSADILKYLTIPHGVPPLPPDFLDAVVTYEACNEAGAEYIEFFNTYIQPAVEEGVRRAIKNGYPFLEIPSADKSSSDIITYTTRERLLLKYNLKNYEVTDAGFALIVTKNSIVITDKEKALNYKKVKGYSKENGELLDNQTLAKVIDTFDRISKLRDNQAADVLATTFINYDVNHNFILSLSKKTNAKTIVKHSKMPPFAAKLHGKKLNPNTIIIKTQGNEKLQNKYLTFVRKSAGEGGSVLEAFEKMLAFFQVYGIELSAVFFTPRKAAWRGHTTFTIGYLFAKETINLDQADLSADCENNSFYIECSDVHTFLNAEGRHKPSLTGRGDFFADPEVQSTFYFNEAKISVRPNILGPIKTKNAKLRLLLSWFAAVGTLNQMVHLKHFANIINQIAKPDPLLNPDLVNRIQHEVIKSRRQQKQVPVQEAKKCDLPFGLYYKIVDSMYD